MLLLEGNLAIVGTGKMGRAIAKAILNNRVLLPGQLIGTDPDPGGRAAFMSLSDSGELGWRNSVAEAARAASAVLLAVKPQQIAEILPAAAQAPAHALFISIAAGIRIASLEQGLGAGRPIARVMPNTPLQISEGVTAICFNAFCSDSQRILVHALFAASGSVYEMPEDRFDIVTALSGSGPAFVYHFIDVMAQSAASQGLCPDDALAMASRTVKGAARMLLETGLSPEELITQVKSKGGTTEAGLKILQCSEFRRIVDDAIRAAAQRSKDLSLA